jgi:hypothetical protein
MLVVSIIPGQRLKEDMLQERRYLEIVGDGLDECSCLWIRWTLWSLSRGEGESVMLSKRGSEEVML